MIKKLYEKSEIWFAVSWIIAYVILASAGDNISTNTGISKIVTLPILTALSVVLFFFVKRNELIENMVFVSHRFPRQRCCFTSR